MIRYREACGATLRRSRSPSGCDFSFTRPVERPSSSVDVLWGAASFRWIKGQWRSRGRRQRRGFRRDRVTYCQAHDRSLACPLVSLVDTTQPGEEPGPMLGSYRSRNLITRLASRSIGSSLPLRSFHQSARSDVTSLFDRIDPRTKPRESTHHRVEIEQRRPALSDTICPCTLP